MISKVRTFCGYIESAKETNASGRSYTNPSKDRCRLGTYVNQKLMKRMREDDDVEEFWSVEPELVRCLNQLAVV